MSGRHRLLAAISASAVLGVCGQSTDGRELFVRPDKGNCIACHQVSDAAGPAVRSNIGSRLDAERIRGWDRARLRQLLHDPMAANPQTVMPPYGRHRLLDSGEIERIIDYLHALP